MTEPGSSEPARPAAARRLATALALILAGAPGILSLLVALPPVEGSPRWALLVNPALLLALFAVAGAWAAPACGLRSLVAARIAGRPVPLVPAGWLRLLMAGAGLGAAIAVLDHATRPLWQPATGLPPSLLDAWSPAGLVVGVLYGGLLEEIVMRWGLMSVLVRAAWKLAARRAPRPPAWAVWTGVAVAALLFAAGHLPALGLGGAALSAPVVARTLLWNGLLGLVFGAVFARRDLESAMACHAGFHIGLAPAYAAVLLAG